MKLFSNCHEFLSLLIRQDWTCRIWERECLAQTNKYARGIIQEETS